MMNRPIRLAFVGTGNWARRYHLPSLDYIRRERLGDCDVALHGIYGPKQDESAELAAKYGFAKTYATLPDLIADREVDAIAVVITPAAVKDVILQLLAMSKPVFTEKPPGLSLAEAQELATRGNVTNVVGFNRRFGVLNNRFKQMIAATPGVQRVAGRMYRKNRTEPDFIRSTGPHLINFMEYLFGDVRTLRNERRTDPVTGGTEFVAHVQFASGLPGEILFSPVSSRHWEGIEVTTADRTLILHSPQNDGPGEIIARNDGVDEVLARNGDHLPILEEGYAWEHVEFLTAISRGSPVRSTFATSVSTMRVAEAIDTGRDLTQRPRTAD